MAKKNKVTKAAIEKIVSLRNDKNHNYTLKDIAKILASDFDIHISQQAVGYHYKRNKNLIIEEAESKSIPTRKPNLSSSSRITESSSIVNKNLNNQSRKEYVELSDEEYQKLMKGE